MPGTQWVFNMYRISKFPHTWGSPDSQHQADTMHLGKQPSPAPSLKVSLIWASNEMSPSARNRLPLLCPYAGWFYQSLTIIFFVPPVPSLWASTQNNGCTWPCVLITSGMRRKLCGLEMWPQRGKWLIQTGKEKGPGAGGRSNQGGKVGSLEKLPQSGRS